MTGHGDAVAVVLQASGPNALGIIRSLAAESSALGSPRINGNSSRFDLPLTFAPAGSHPTANANA